MTGAVWAAAVQALLVPAAVVTPIIVLALLAALLRPRCPCSLLISCRPCKPSRVVLIAVWAMVLLVFLRVVLP